MEQVQCQNKPVVNPEENLVDSVYFGNFEVVR